MTTYKKWNKKEIAKLKRLWKNGKKLREIAEQLDRTLCSVSGMVSKLQKSGDLTYRHVKKTKSVAPAKKYLKELAKEMTREYPSHPFRQPVKATQKKWTMPKSTATKIQDACDEICTLLLAKNKAYGDSAFTPIRIFSKSDASEQLKVRIDDKLNRLLQGDTSIEADEDVIKDLVGYLVLLLINMRE